MTRFHRHWVLCLVTALSIAGLVALMPGRSVGADNETFFSGTAPCPIAHCNQHLDGRETSNGSMLDIPVSTAPSGYATYTPSPAIAFNSALGCSTGQSSPSSTPNLVECDGTQPSGAGSSAGPFVYDLTAGESNGAATLTLNWKSASYTGQQSYPCTYNTPFAMDGYVSEGAPLFSDYGYTYVSDDKSIAKYTPTA